MKERPILFSAPMVRAILDGRKTQTRRVVKLRNGQYMPPSEKADINGWRQMLRNCPYGQPGDRLWVRETHFDAKRLNEGRILYRADGDVSRFGWTPSIHMPRSASRITLEVTGVRVERLQDISEADAVAEGVVWEQGQTAINVFETLWESINGAGSWDANPWVWVVEFKRAKGSTANAAD